MGLNGGKLTFKQVLGFVVLIIMLALPLLIVTTAVFVPILDNAGYETQSNTLFFTLSPICHQLFTRSLWIFDHPMGLCARCFSIYMAFFVGGIILIWKRWEEDMDEKGAKPLWTYGLILIVPLLIDGFTQLFGLRQSNTILRFITGSLTGIGLAMIIFPFIMKLKRTEVTEYAKD